MRLKAEGRAHRASHRDAGPASFGAGAPLSHEESPSSTAPAPVLLVRITTGGHRPRAAGPALYEDRPHMAPQRVTPVSVLPSTTRERDSPSWPRGWEWTGRCRAAWSWALCRLRPHADGSMPRTWCMSGDWNI